MGRDKAGIVVSGETLAERAERVLAEVADPVVVVGSEYGGGPLVALATAVERGVIPTDRAALVLAVDMPFVEPGFLRRLADHPADGSVVPVDETGRWQPLCARWSAAALAALPALVAGGARSMHAWLDAVPVVAVVADDPAVLTDLDAPEDLARLGD